MGFSGSSLVSLVVTGLLLGCYWVFTALTCLSLDFSGYHWVFTGFLLFFACFFTGFYWISLDFREI